jgi:DNA-binding transcriptional LysR family regulator
VVSGCAALPATHPLARLRALTSADLDGEPILDAHTRGTSSVEEKFELIAAGHGIALVPRSVARSYSRPDLVYRPGCGRVAADRPELPYGLLTSGREEASWSSTW